MLTRQTKELNLIYSDDPKPTVEICAESCEAAGLDVADTLEPVLSRFAKANPNERATISMYGSMSTTFHEHSWSDFLIVDGSQRVLRAVAGAFNAQPRVKSRTSDSISPALGQAIFHIEDGCCWQAVDAMTWETQEDASGETNGGTSDDLAGEVDSADGQGRGTELADEWCAADGSDVPDAPKRGRLRAARSDARIGAIKQTIEQLFGLPEGSVALCGPDRKALRVDATIGTLRRRWEA